MIRWRFLSIERTRLLPLAAAAAKLFQVNLTSPMPRNVDGEHTCEIRQPAQARHASAPLEKSTKRKYVRMFTKNLQIHTFAARL